MPLQVLIVEDRPADAELMVLELRKAGFEPEWKRVDTESGLEANLNPDLDVVLCDYSLPQLSILRVLDLVAESKTGVPVIIVSGAIGEEKAAECLRLGATDYIPKGHMARLGAIVRRAIAERLTKVAKREAEASMNRGEGRIREELQRREEQGRQVQVLTELNEFKSQFLNMVAHDLNNVVTPMRVNLHGLTKAAAKGDLPGHEKSIALVNRGLERLLAFLADLLDAARLQSGHLSIQAQRVDLAEHVASIIDAVRADADAKGLRLDADLPASLAITGDAGRIDQVLTNLLNNALKFTPCGGKVTVALKESGAGAQVAVADTGVGLDAGDAIRLFQPFSKIGSSAQDKHTGTGLGLFICRGIVEGHGGKIWVESEGHGNGSTFFVWLPAAGPGAPQGSAGPAR